MWHRAMPRHVAVPSCSTVFSSGLAQACKVAQKLPLHSGGRTGTDRQHKPSSFGGSALTFRGNLCCVLCGQHYLVCFLLGGAGGNSTLLSCLCRGQCGFRGEVLLELTPACFHLQCTARVISENGGLQDALRCVCP